MNQVFSTSTEDYHPISHGDSYLYENYQRVLAFLKPRLKSKELSCFSKPIHSNGLIDWYSYLPGPMKKLEFSSNDVQQKVEKEYVAFLSKINRITDELIRSGNKEEIAWAELINEVFKTEDNLLISNGSDWAMLWGWKFRNKLNFVTPSFGEVRVEDATDLKLSSISQEDVPIEKKSEIATGAEVDELNQEDEVVVADHSLLFAPEKRKMTIWERLKRFFRKVAYRYWGLFFLIILFLIILCVCRTCSNLQNENNLNQFENDLNEIERNLEDRCAEQLELDT